MLRWADPKFLAPVLLVSTLQLTAQEKERNSEEIDRRVVFAAAPEWNHIMYHQRVQGDFKVAVTVSPDGDVVSADVITTFWNQFDPLHERIASRWQFEEQSATSEHVITFSYEYAAFETREEELGTMFEAPYKVIVRKYFPDDGIGQRDIRRNR